MKFKINDDWLAEVLIVVSLGHLLIPTEKDNAVFHHWLFALVGIITVALRWALKK